jgi:hypothetical protein
VTIGPGEFDYESAESTVDVLLEWVRQITDLDIFSNTYASHETLIQDKEILQEALERWIMRALKARRMCYWNVSNGSQIWTFFSDAHAS